MRMKHIKRLKRTNKLKTSRIKLMMIRYMYDEVEIAKYKATAH